MAATARKLKQKPALKIFHASMLVTRAEQWWVEAETADEARALLAAGEGHRSTSDERVHVEVERLLEGGE